MMNNNLRSLVDQLVTDESGFVSSAELVIICTVLVLGLVVGLSELSTGINQELEDIGSAVGSMNQSFQTKGGKGHKGSYFGSLFKDMVDDCDNDCNISCDAARPEGY